MAKRNDGRRCVLLDRDDLPEAVADHLRAGMPLRLIGQAVGVHADTMTRWHKQARKILAEDRENESPTTMALCRFHRITKSAEAEGAREMVEIIRGAARAGTWQAAAWMLERRHPAYFSREGQLLKSGPEDARSAIVVPGMALPGRKESTAGSAPAAGLA